MSDFIINSDIFDKTITEYLKSKKGISWQSIENSEKKKVLMNKLKYTCLGCNLNVWGKSGIRVKCGECDVELLEI